MTSFFMKMAVLIRKLFWLSDHKIDLYAAIFAVVILSRGHCGVTDRSRTLLIEHAKILFRSKVRQGVFVEQVTYFLEGGTKGERDINALVKFISQNSKRSKKLIDQLPYELFEAYKNDAVLQNRVLEFLDTLNYRRRRRLVYEPK